MGDKVNTETVRIRGVSIATTIYKSMVHHDQQQIYINGPKQIWDLRLWIWFLTRHRYFEHVSLISSTICAYKIIHLIFVIILSDHLGKRI